MCRKERLILCALLAVLMLAFSVLEAMAFRETGQRLGHGNFTWASNSSSFFLWVVMAGVFLREMRARLDRAEEDQRPGILLAARFGLAALEGGEDVCL